MILKEHELIKVEGGNTNISGSLLNSVATLINTVLGIGRTIGSALRMATSGTRC